MNLSELQNEINHLLFLYFTSIGAIQRDANLPVIGRHVRELAGEIERCKERIDQLLHGESSEEELPEDFEETIQRGREFIEDGFAFIDKVIGK